MPARDGGLVLIDRGDYWQCGYVITKGTVDALKDGMELVRFAQRSLRSHLACGPLQGDPLLG